MIPVADVLARTSLVDLVGRVVKLKRRGRDHWGLCPFHGERTPSFKVDPKGFFRCFGCGAGGDAIVWMKQAHGLDFRAALDELAAIAGMSQAKDGTRRPLRAPVPKPSPEDDERDRKSTIEWCRKVWAKATPAAGTLVEVYLRGRGIQVPPPSSLRFAPALRHSDTGQDFPAMVAAVQDIAGRIVGLHRTYLTLDGRKKAQVESPRKMAGQCWGGAVRFAAVAPRLAIAEGIETALSAAQACPDLAGRAGLAVWAALSLGNIAGGGRGDGRVHPRHPDRKLPSERPDKTRPGLVLPDAVSEVVILADSDNADPEAAEALLQRGARRFAAQGRTVRIARPPAGKDFNDVLMRQR